jgi:diguanylate cyclase (GGDEF)-like protein
MLFVDRLNQAIKYANRSHEQIAILFLDLDHFKEINDSLGHSTGDELLKIVASRLLKAVRQSDTVSRLGGDEFAIILDRITSMDTVGHLLDSIIKDLNKPYILDSHELYVTPSIGISVYPDDGLESDMLLKYSDAAMYKAKNNGRNNYQFYTEDMTERALERIVLETKLRQSLEKNEMNVYYQVQVDATDDSVIGMEALIRWRHPELGIVSPAKFLPLAQEIGYIIELDEWVMEEGIKQFKTWKENGLNPGILSLNLTPQRLEKESFIPDLKNILNKYEFDTSWLSFEVTESQVMKNQHMAIKTLKEIHDLGIMIAIDDFGTGYSSLSYLKELPIDKLKIDQSFVKDIPHDNDDVEITRTIISMAKGLGLSVIAEGVENEEQKEFLLKHGCNQIQGYLYHKPAIHNEVHEYLLKQVI